MQTHILSITDANGCNRIDSFELFNPAEVTSETFTDTLSCIGFCDGNGVVIADDGDIDVADFIWADDDDDDVDLG